jgi:hypothetical protein
LISLIIMYAVARSAIKSRAWQFVFCVIGAIMPFMIVIAIVEHGLRLKSSRMDYRDDYAAVEDAIEERRISIFGGELLHPSFAQRWQQAYESEMQRVVIWSDKTTRRLRHLKHHFGIAN